MTLASNSTSNDLFLNKAGERSSDRTRTEVVACRKFGATPGHETERDLKRCEGHDCTSEHRHQRREDKVAPPDGEYHEHCGPKH